MRNTRSRWWVSVAQVLLVLLGLKGLEKLLTVALPTVNAGDQILAADINTHIQQTNTNTANITTATGNITSLQGSMTTVQHQLNQPNGGSESGGYFLAGNGYTSGAVISDYIGVVSRGNTIASVSIDTSSQSPTGGAGSPGTGALTGSGFQVFSIVSGASTNARLGGNWTAHF